MESPKSGKAKWLSLSITPLVVALLAFTMFTKPWVLEYIERGLDKVVGVSEIPRRTKVPNVNITHAPGVKVVDFSEPDLPKVRTNSRVMDLVHATHFDDILGDSPDELRPSTAILFYDSNNGQCMDKFLSWKWDHVAETILPGRELLFAARYDMYAAPRRPWFKFVPEMDLTKRLKVTKCPELVFVSRTCNGATDWCVNKKNGDMQTLGCQDFKTQCTDFESWDEQGDMVEWINNKMSKDGTPKLSAFLGSYERQNQWLRERDSTSTNNHLRNIYMSQAFPAFTKDGFRIARTPEPVQEWLTDFVKKSAHIKRIETWDSASTQLNFVETQTSMYDLGRSKTRKEEMAIKYLKPLVEEWSGIQNLKLTSFYGVREYPRGSLLRNHVDRIDTHILSITISVGKTNQSEDDLDWPLEVIDWNGNHVRYTHPEGYMVLYESSKLPHGRPYPNKGAIHLGAFCHFLPEDRLGTDSRDWSSFADIARDNLESHIQKAEYRSTAPFNPTNIEYSGHSYGQEAIWKSKSAAKDTNGRIVRTFQNNAQRKLALHWIGRNGLVLQAVIQPNESHDIHTFVGHEFVWSEFDETVPAKGAKKFAITAKQALYFSNL